MSFLLSFPFPSHPSPNSFFSSCDLEVKFLYHNGREDHKSLWTRKRAGAQDVGRPVPDIHGGEGHTRGQSASCGQEAPGPVQALRLRQRDWRFSAGEKKCLKVNLFKRRYIFASRVFPAGYAITFSALTTLLKKIEFRALIFVRSRFWAA